MLLHLFRSQYLCVKHILVEKMFPREMDTEFINCKHFHEKKSNYLRRPDTLLPNEMIRLQYHEVFSCSQNQVGPAMPLAQDLHLTTR